MKRALIFLIIIFISNLVGMYYGMYVTWWFDMLHHFLGGFFMAMLMVHYLGLRTKDLGLSPLKTTLVVVGAVSFVGIVWEFAEYLASQTLIEPIYNSFAIRAYFIGDLDDTMNDLLMDVVGALAWLAVFRKR